MSLSQNDIRPPGNEDAKDLLCSVLYLVFIDLVDVDRVDVDAIHVDQSTDLLMLTMLMLTLLMLTMFMLTIFLFRGGRGSETDFPSSPSTSSQN